MFSLYGLLRVIWVLLVVTCQHCKLASRQFLNNVQQLRLQTCSSSCKMNSCKKKKKTSCCRRRNILRTTTEPSGNFFGLLLEAQTISGRLLEWRCTDSHLLNGSAALYLRCLCPSFFMFLPFLFHPHLSPPLTVTLPSLLSYSCGRNLRGIWPCLCNLCEMGFIIHRCDLICIVRRGNGTYERRNRRELFTDLQWRVKFLKAFNTTSHRCCSV